MDFLSHSLGCILLLNGWKPVPLAERATSAEVVISGYVEETYKDNRTESDTYTAKLSVINVLKGMQLLDKLPRLIEKGERVFNVSNFGDTVMCYSDVEEGYTYFFFLTIFKDSLSGKYDDIFGATTEFNAQNEELVLAALGKCIYISNRNIRVSIV